MGVTKTDFMRGMQCPRMLWLDKHHPEFKIIPPETREKLRRGNEFGDRMMGIFGPYVEVREFFPGTSRPDKKRMAEKTAELITAGTPVICEAAFLDGEGNYCAADILRKDEETGQYDLYEVKNSPEIGVQHIKDAGFQACLIRKTGLPVRKVFLIFHPSEPYEIRDITDEADRFAGWVSENLQTMGEIGDREEEFLCPTGAQCADPYECWYIGYCRMKERGELDLPRCSWCNIANPLYVKYHDEEWGTPCHDDHALYELFILESFQAGLSWEIVLNKREHFREAYDNFDIDKVCGYGEEKIESLLRDKGIIRNKLKVKASVKNSRIFKEIQKEFGSFDRYLEHFTGGKIICENDPAVVRSELSDAISKDLGKRGMSFVGSVIIYSYLQAIGIINAHSDGCFRAPGNV